jgi:hypothetical protein
MTDNNVITLPLRQEFKVCITITNDRGIPVAHPANRQAELLAKIAGRETLTRETLNLALDMGFEVILHHGAGDFRVKNPDKLFGALARTWMNKMVDEELEKALRRSREQWAERRRTPYHDLMPEVSDRIADYATEEEIAALKLAMRERWKELGRKARNEPENPDDLPWQRRCINRGLKLIESGKLPFCLEDKAGAEDLLAPFHALYEAAKAELYERASEEIAQTPVDDEAWKRELRRRADRGRHLAPCPEQG